MPRSSASRLAVVSASGEMTNRLRARVSALTCHQPTGFAALRPSFAYVRNSTVSAAAGSRLGPRANLRRTVSGTRVHRPFRCLVSPGGGVDGYRAGAGDAGVRVDRVTAAVGAGDVRPVALAGRGGVPATVGGRPDSAPGRPHLAGADLRGGQLRAGTAGRRGGSDPRDRPRARRRVLARRRRAVRGGGRSGSR